MKFEDENLGVIIGLVYLYIEQEKTRTIRMRAMYDLAHDACAFLYHL